MKRRKLITTLVLAVTMLVTVNVPGITSKAELAGDHEHSWDYSQNVGCYINLEDETTHDIGYRCRYCDEINWENIVHDYKAGRSWSSGDKKHQLVEICRFCEYEKPTGIHVDCNFVLYTDAYDYEDYSDVHYELWYCKDECDNYYYVEKPHEFSDGVCSICGYEYKERPVVVDTVKEIVEKEIAMELVAVSTAMEEEIGSEAEGEETAKIYDFSAYSTVEGFTAGLTKLIELNNALVEESEVEATGTEETTTAEPATVKIYTNYAVAFNGKMANALASSKVDVEYYFTHNDVLYKVTIPANIGESELFEQNTWVGPLYIGYVYGTSEIVK